MTSGPSAFGAPPVSVATGTTSILVARANQARMKMILINDSDTTIYITRGDFARLNAGIRLNANGGSLVDEPDSLGRIYTGPWSAISSAASKNLCVSEE